MHDRAVQDRRELVEAAALCSVSANIEANHCFSGLGARLERDAVMIAINGAYMAGSTVSEVMGDLRRETDWLSSINRTVHG